MTSPLWILTYPRSGTSLLVSLLNQIRTNGNRIFDPPMHEWYNKKNLKKYGEPTNPPLNCKLHWGHASRFKITPERIEQSVPDVKYAILERRDAIAQAASSYIVAHTQVTNLQLKNQEELEEFRRTPIPLNIRDLKETYTMTRRRTARHWINWLKGRPCMLCTYKQLVDDHMGVVGRVLEHIGYTADLDADPVVIMAKLNHPCNQQIQDILWKLVNAGKLLPPIKED